MIKKTVEYENIDGQMVKEELYFHLNKTQMLQLQFEYNEKGGFAEHMQKLLDENKNKELLDVIKDVVVLAYGERDGDRFVRSHQKREAFQDSEAFDQLIWELATDDQKASEFMSGVFPRDIVERIAKEVDLEMDVPGTDETIVSATAVDDSSPKVLTPAEAEKMDPAELVLGLQTGKFTLKTD